MSPIVLEGHHSDPLDALSELERARRCQNALDYIRVRSGALPRHLQPAMTEPVLGEMIHDTLRRQQQLTIDYCRQEADKGSDLYLLELGLRTLAGLGTRIDKRLAGRYLERLLKLPDADKGNKAQAHALMLDCHDVLDTNTLQSRQLTAYQIPRKVSPTTLREAAYHADEAARPGLESAPSVLAFAKKYQPLIDKHPGILRGKEYLWKAWEKRETEMAKEDEELRTKRDKKPSRYRCATEGCGVEATSGKALKRCGGPCAEIYKPSYCSAECQKKGWVKHKPLCKPGSCGGQQPTQEIRNNRPETTARARELDIFTTHPEFASATNSNARVSLPIAHPDGGFVNISAPPRALKILKSLQEEAKRKEAGSTNCTF